MSADVLRAARERYIAKAIDAADRRGTPVERGILHALLAIFFEMRAARAERMEDYQ